MIDLNIDCLWDLIIRDVKFFTSMLAYCMLKHFFLNFHVLLRFGMMLINSCAAVIDFLYEYFPNRKFSQTALILASIRQKGRAAASDEMGSENSV